MKTKPIIRVVTATEAKNRFGDLIKGAYLRDEHLIIKRGGIPVVAIVPMADYERLVNPKELPENIAEELRQSDEQMRARSRLVQYLKQVHKYMPEVPEEEVEADIQEAIQAVRQQKRAQQANHRGT